MFCTKFSSVVSSSLVHVFGPLFRFAALPDPESGFGGPVVAVGLGPDDPCIGARCGGYGMG
jgi:hypothetical protein